MIAIEALKYCAEVYMFLTPVDVLGLTLPDLHNRRDNIASVAKEVQRNLYPLLTWPEDKILLKLEDLPLIQGRNPNIPASWTKVRTIGERSFNSDRCFRDWLIVGKAYYRSFVHHSGLTIVTALEVTTYA